MKNILSILFFMLFYGTKALAVEDLFYSELTESASFKYRGKHVVFDASLDKNPTVQDQCTHGFSGLPFLEATADLVKPKSIVIDMDADIGNDAVFWASICGADVISFTLAGEARESFSRNIDYNGLGEKVQSIECMPTLVSESFPNPVALMKIGSRSCIREMLTQAKDIIQHDTPELFLTLTSGENFDELSRLLHSYGYIFNGKSYGNKPNKSYHFSAQKKKVILWDDEADVDIVVARYNENASWIRRHFPFNRVTIYNKGPKLEPPTEHSRIIDLDNVGRESHTYLEHIIRNFSSLNKYILFLQGHPFDHGGLALIELVKRGHFRFTPDFKSLIVPGDVKVFKLRTVIEGSIERDVPSRFAKSKWAGTLFSATEYADIVGYAEFIGIDIWSVEKVLLNWGAQFMVQRDKILKNDEDYYRKIQGTLLNKAPVEGHYLERLWDLVFF